METSRVLPLLDPAGIDTGTERSKLGSKTGSSWRSSEACAMNRMRVSVDRLQLWCKERLAIVRHLIVWLVHQGIGDEESMHD